MLLFIGYLSGFVNIFGFIPYVRDIFKGTTRPERISWFIWLILGFIAFASQFAEGARASLWMPAIQTIGVAYIFLLSLTKGEGGFKKLDIVALIVTVVGLILWYVTQEAAWALFFVILVDAAGMSLTTIKCYKDPGSETLAGWVFYAISGLLATISVGSLNGILLAYPVYIFLANLSAVLAILAGRKKQLAVRER